MVVSHIWAHAVGGGSSRNNRRINKSANIEEDERLFLENQKQ